MSGKGKIWKILPPYFWNKTSRYTMCIHVILCGVIWSKMLIPQSSWMFFSVWLELVKFVLICVGLQIGSCFNNYLILVKFWLNCWNWGWIFQWQPYGGKLTDTVWQKPIFKKSVVEQKTAATRDNQNIRYNTKTRYVNNKILSDSSLPVLFGGQT